MLCIRPCFFKCAKTRIIDFARQGEGEGREERKSGDRGGEVLAHEVWNKAGYTASGAPKHLYKRVNEKA